MGKFQLGRLNQTQKQINKNSKKKAKNEKKMVYRKIKKQLESKSTNKQQTNCKMRPSLIIQALSSSCSSSSSSNSGKLGSRTRFTSCPVVQLSWTCSPATAAPLLTVHCPQSHSISIISYDLYISLQPQTD